MGESLKKIVVCSITELIATALFVFVGAGSCISSDVTEKVDGIELNQVDSARLLIIAFGHGFAILFLVFATAHVSGGHINPTVTLAMIVTRNMPPLKGLSYIVSQFVGGLLGAAFLRLCFSAEIAGEMGSHNLGNDTSIFGGIALEFFITFILVYVIFSSAINTSAPSKFAPIAIGLTILVNHLIAVPFTGASMNPARTFGTAAVSNSNWDHIYVYFVGPPLGALAAGLSYQHGILHSQYNTKPEYTILNA